MRGGEKIYQKKSVGGYNNDVHNIIWCQDLLRLLHNIILINICKVLNNLKKN